jgi:hypothetical protein
MGSGDIQISSFSAGCQAEWTSLSNSVYRGSSISKFPTAPLVRTLFNEGKISIHVQEEHASGGPVQAQRPLQV